MSTITDQTAELYAHLASAHSCVIDVPSCNDFSLLQGVHDHEHRGPCTIRNHPYDSREYRLTKLFNALKEVEDD